MSVSGASKIVDKTKRDNQVDVKKLPKWRLLEILERQKKLSLNKAALNKLPDKGEKILGFKKEVEDELEQRESSDNLHEAMAGLSLNADLNEIEWSGKIGERSVQSNGTDVIEGEKNPIKILVSHSGAGFHKKIIRNEEPPKELITKNDIENFAINLCNKLDTVEATKKFLPHKTLNKVKEVPKDKERDLSSATPPVSKFGALKLVSLEDSLKLQIHQAQQLKEVQLKHAAERLKDKTYRIGEIMPKEESRKVYREVNNVDSEEEAEEEEEGAHDSGGIVYTLEHEN